MEVMINIKNSWLGEELFKDIISIDDLLDLIQEKYDEVDYLKGKLQEKQETIEEHYIDEHHDMKVLGKLDE